MSDGSRQPHRGERALRPPPMLGVWVPGGDGRSPAARLRARVAAPPTPLTADTRIAITGGRVHVEPDGLLVAGDLVLDDAPELATRLGRPEATALELFAALWRRSGPEAGAQLLGMFAVVVWDESRGRAWLVRDPIGERTLYAACEPDGAWWWSDTLAPLRRAGVVRDRLSPTALRNYLTYAYVPGRETLWADAVEVRPGEALELPTGERRSYWQARERPWDASASPESHAREVRRLVEDAVVRRMPATGPIGVYLSGGVDSSVITAVLARAAPGRVTAYSVHFGPDYPHELPFARMVAERTGVRHREILLPAARVRDGLFDTVAALDDPVGDPLTVPNLLLGHAAAAEVGVIFNGEGGDPIFGGPKNQGMLLHELYGGIGPRAGHAGTGMAASGGDANAAVALDRESAYLRAYHKCYDDLPQLLTPAVLRELDDAPPQRMLLVPYLSASPMRSYLNRLLHTNLSLKGADHILTKVNNLTRAAGVLGRSPLFDRRIVEHSFAMPPTAKLRGTVEKAVLKQAFADLLPEPVILRPKAGMRVPVHGWYRSALKRHAQRLLLAKDARTAPYLRRDTIAEWIAYRGDPWARYGRKLWLLVTLEAWMRAQEQPPP